MAFLVDRDMSVIREFWLSDRRHLSINKGLERGRGAGRPQLLVYYVVHKSSVFHLEVEPSSQALERGRERIPRLLQLRTIR